MAIVVSLSQHCRPGTWNKFNSFQVRTYARAYVRRSQRDCCSKVWTCGFEQQAAKSLSWWWFTATQRRLIVRNDYLKVIFMFAYVNNAIVHSASESNVFKEWRLKYRVTFWTYKFLFRLQAVVVPVPPTGTGHLKCDPIFLSVPLLWRFHCYNLQPKQATKATKICEPRIDFGTWSRGRHMKAMAHMEASSHRGNKS